MADATSSLDGITGEAWAGDDGRRWLSNLDRFEGMLAPIGEALIARAAFAPGERVVDIGCGGGWTTRSIGGRVGSSGLAIGIDISADLVDAANARARAAGLPNVRFVAGDAAVAMPEDAPFDRLFSRFGCMFFDQPYAAFANLRRMLRSGGRLDIAVWGPANENPWVSQVMAVASRHIEMPPPVPRAPGPFALGDTDYVRDLLTSGGFSNPEISVWTGTQPIGGPGSSPAEAADFVLEAMHVGDAASGADPAVKAAIRSDLAEMFARHQTPDGVVAGANALFVTAFA